jgi:RNA polymerase sigma-70 factor (ECF subfamily)
MFAQPVVTSLKPAAERDDETLVTLFQAGDAHAFRHLVERHTERVRNLIHSIFRYPDLVDDLTQEVFIKVYRALPAFRFDAAFTTWLYRITVNLCRDEMRKRKVRSLLTFQPLDFDVEDRTPDSALHVMTDPSASDMSGQIHSALNRLPDKFRVPVVLKDIEGMSYEEMADVMQCELGTVKSRLSRGRTLLRTHLKPLLES